MARQAVKRWQNPVLFTHEVLGLKTWRRQRGILQASVAHDWNAIHSGHKCTKSTTLSCAALAWVSTRPRARVILTAPSHRQVDGILWKEISRLYRNARLPLGGELHKSAEKGLQFPDGREIIGFSTDEPERFAGYSGPNTLFLVDEASGVPTKIQEAIIGNLAGGGKIIATSNPTLTSGWFYEACTSANSTWNVMHISSWDAAREAHLELGHGTGIATVEWCQARLDEWGEDDPRYQVRVLGNFPSQSDAALIGERVVRQSASLWTPEPPAQGFLTFGVDVARYGSDFTSISWARGDWLSEPKMLKGFDNVEVAGEVLELIRRTQRNGERCEVRVDCTNQGGVADILRRHEHSMNFEVVDIQYAGASPVPGCSRMRDALWCGMRDWLKGGGRIPPDEKLRSDLLSPLYGFDATGAIKVEGKKELRKRIGRSTDRGDSSALAVYRDNLPDTATQVFSDKYSNTKSRW